MKLSELIEFNKASFFNGAVQADWFYDEQKCGEVAKSYVFHGPKYFGVNVSDVAVGRHKLVDTASFVKNISDRLYGTISNSFILTIAGYGTGKSHLSVALASLFSGNDDKLRNAVLDKLIAADKIIGDGLKETITGRNLIITLNGMGNFNLDYEVLKCAKNALSMHGLDAEVLDDMTKAYKTARYFVEQTFELVDARFKNHAKRHKFKLEGKDFKQFLLDNIETNVNVFETVNQVYNEINGNFIRWDEGITAGEILSKLNQRLCVERKVFGKILILFDEFGRYIEFAAANPSIASESALQQIFEAVQNSNNIMFVGFIQSDLNAYLSRIEKTSNIVRYVGRYEGSDKYYISSNFETILANLMVKRDARKFEARIGYVLENKYKKYHLNLFENIKRWLKGASERSVWSNRELYDSVVLKGCYPYHPITIWMLSSLSSWVQQRSTLTFAEEFFNEMSSSEVIINELDYIYPISIIESDLFNELINAEEKGMQQSQHCLLYKDLIIKYGDKLSDDLIKILRAILIMNIGKFELYDKTDALSAIIACTGMNKDEVSRGLHQLETSLGILQYDEMVNKYEFITEASGLNEFNRELMKRLIQVKNVDIIEGFDEIIEVALSLDKPQDTQFGLENKINSTEWKFTKKIVAIEDVDGPYINALLSELNKAVDGETSRGIIIWLYCDQDTYGNFGNVSYLIRERNLYSYPIIFWLINDVDGDIKQSVKRRAALKAFPLSEKQRFEKFVDATEKKYVKKIIKTFHDLSSHRYIVTEIGVEKSELRLSEMCSHKFSSIYKNTVPFLFDGFEKKLTPKIKRYFYEICTKLADNTLANTQSYQSLPPDLKNRVKAVLSTQSNDSWMVFNNNCMLGEPQNTRVSNVYQEVMEAMQLGKSVNGRVLFSKYLYHPYGMNKYSLALFIIYFVVNNNRTLNLYASGSRVKLIQLVQELINDNSFQLENFFKLGFQMSEATNGDRIVDLCYEILRNVYVENCEKHKSELNRLLDEEDVVPENEDKVSSARMKLQDGDRLYGVIYGNLNRAYQLLKELAGNFQLQKSLKIHPLVRHKGKAIEVGNDYVYSDEYEAKCLEITSKTDILIDKYAPAFIDRLHCGITELSTYKSVYTSLAATLNHLGKEQLSTHLLKRLAELEIEINSKQKYEQIISNCQQEIMFIAGKKNSDYKACRSDLDKVDEWKGHFDNITDLSTKVKQNIMDRIDETRLSLLERIADLEKTVTNVCLKLRQITGETALNGIYNEIKSLTDSGFSKEILEELEGYLKLIDSFNELIAQYKNIEQIEHDTLINKLPEHINLFKGTALAICAHNWLSEIQDTLSKRELLWKQRYVIAVQSKVDAMSINECINWTRITAERPAYLTQKTVTEYGLVSKKVNDRIKECRVQGVVSMFNELTDDEKNECLNILNFIIRSKSFG